MSIKKTRHKTDLLKKMMSDRIVVGNVLTQLSKKGLSELKKQMKRPRGRPRKVLTYEEKAEKKVNDEAKTERQRVREEKKQEKMNKPKRGRGRPRKVWTDEEIDEKKSMDEAKTERQRVREEKKTKKHGSGRVKKGVTGSDKVTEAMRRVMVELEVLMMELGY